MKIYNKKKFIGGIFFCVLGTLNLVAGLIHNLSVKDTVLILILFCFGVSGLLRSLSKQCSRQDRLEEKDERNQLVVVKSRAKAFQIMESYLVISGFLFTLFGVISNENVLSYIGIGLLFSWNLSITIEFFTSLYYDKHE